MRDFIEYTFDFIDANVEGKEERLEELIEEGKGTQTTYAEVAQAVTNIIVGINQQLSATNQELQILVDALVEDGILKDSTLDIINEKLKENKG